ncbi:MAG: hypothetical protein Q8L07_12530 [Sediminibacterium sp.]|nr:hypothetical protein [Sediminibacterium sp.]
MWKTYLIAGNTRILEGNYLIFGLRGGSLTREAVILATGFGNRNPQMAVNKALLRWKNHFFSRQIVDTGGINCFHWY